MRERGCLAAVGLAVSFAGLAAGCGGHAASESWASANGSVASRRAVTATALDARTIPRLRVRWRFRLHANVAGFGAITSNPIIRGDVVYVQDSTSSVYALDVRSGALRWKHTIRRAERRPERAHDLGLANLRRHRHDGVRTRCGDRTTALVASAREPVRAVRRHRADRRSRPRVRQHAGLPAGRPRCLVRTLRRDGQDRLALPDDQGAVAASREERRRRLLVPGQRRRARQRVRGHRESRLRGVARRRSRTEAGSPALRSTPTLSSCSPEPPASSSGTTR